MIKQERLIDSFCDLVRIDSPSDEEEEVAQHLTDRLSRLGFSVARDAHGNVIASEDGENPLLLSAHMDTVEPGRGIQPIIKGDRITSDGTTILGGDCGRNVGFADCGYPSQQTFHRPLEQPGQGLQFFEGGLKPTGFPSVNSHF